MSMSLLQLRAPIAGAALQPDRTLNPSTKKQSRTLIVHTARPYHKSLTIPIHDADQERSAHSNAPGSFFSAAAGAGF